MNKKNPDVRQTSTTGSTLLLLFLLLCNLFLATREATLEEPHDDDVVGEGDGVLVELEGVGVGQADGDHRHVLVVVEARKHFG